MKKDSKRKSVRNFYRFSVFFFCLLQHGVGGILESINRRRRGDRRVDTFFFLLLHLGSGHVRSFMALDTALELSLQDWT
ncbi:hypothetical protein F4678DRAFT_422808 [Xylaria arbuscula]|nr:hypothetical protein F4678DRAFT_422808 [Xylaria arbuscula]